MTKQTNFVVSDALRVNEKHLNFHGMCCQFCFIVQIFCGIYVPVLAECAFMACDNLFSVFISVRFFL